MLKTAAITPFLSVSPQITEAEMGIIAAQGFRAVINNRPDGEESDQVTAERLAAAAARHDLTYRHLPVVSGKVTDDDVAAFAATLDELHGPVLAFCRTGTRSTTLWALSQAEQHSSDAVLKACAAAGYDLSSLEPRLIARGRTASLTTEGARGPVDTGPVHDVVIVGGGGAGIAAAASLRKRRADLSIAVIEPSDKHYYQPGFTLVGGGAFDRNATERDEARCIPAGVKWIHAAAAGFEPDHGSVVLEDGERVHYRTLVVCPGIKLDWHRIAGLAETLGRNGVTSNYRFDMAPYTWQLVQALKTGRALFTQPPMPIKCAGAPQKAMYLSCDHWRRQGRLGDLEVEFHTAGGVLFGVQDFVPTLQRYVERYGAQLNFGSNLMAVDGPAGKAWFDVAGADGETRRVEKDFDLLHVAPPQCAPDFLRDSPLADAAGWVEVDPETLQHPRYGNVFGLGDACSAPNAKTAAAVRKQAPVVAENLLAVLDGHSPRAVYDGYGSCPLIVERGKVVLAEFGYGGKLLPTFPLKPTVPRRSMWTLKAKLMPTLYWDLMLKGHEWAAQPQRLDFEPTAHEALAARDYQEAATGSEAAAGGRG